MKVSEKYNLERKQASLDFVDIDIVNDLKLFVDPRALRLLETDWSNWCVSLVQSFFQEIINCIRKGKNDRAKSLLCVLREPNETHLGLSKGKSDGKALGPQSSVVVHDALLNSDAIKTGLIENLEDTILLIPGISSDIISDITTNIIRVALIKYTQYICAYYEIPVEQDVDSGPLWNPENKEWYSEYTNLPVVESGKLIFVPKVIVRKVLDYNDDEYYSQYIMKYLQEREISLNTQLVKLLKNGKPRVYKKDLKLKYGSGKNMIAQFTLQHPEILDRYRTIKKNRIKPPLEHGEITYVENEEETNWNELMGNVKQLKPGKENATKYEKAIEKLLSALFYPSLSSPELQRKINEGRKRVDLVYNNIATYGFFAWLGSHYNAPYIFLECKNYSSDPENPELDQLSGRFSRERGDFGLLICRRIDNRDLLRKRCIDTANAGRGFIIALDDSDLESLVNDRIINVYREKYIILQKMFDEIVL